MSHDPETPLIEKETLKGFVEKGKGSVHVSFNSNKCKLPKVNTFGKMMLHRLLVLFN